MKRRAGFTLIEVLIAVSLTALALSAIYGVFTAVFRIHERVVSESETAHIGRVIFERVGREVRGAWWPQQPPPPAPQVELFFEAGRDRDGRQVVRFATASTTLAATGRGGIAAIRYGLAPLPDGPRDRFYLMRNEEPYHQRDRLDDGGYPMSGDVKSVAWRFYGPGGWVDTWSADATGKLPQLVEMTVTLFEKDKEVVLRGIFDLPDLPQ